MKYAVLLLALFASPAWADDSNSAHQFFYRAVDKGWEVFGNVYPDHSKRHDTCSIARSWDDGSQFQVNKDLQENTLYLWMQNMDWNDGDPKGTELNFRINAFGNNRIIGGSELSFYVVTKNIMYSADLNQAKFLDDFAPATVLKFVAPGSVQNFTVPVENLGGKLINALADCIGESKNATPAPETKLPNLDSPIAEKKESL